jgi:hypothetical protein
MAVVAGDVVVFGDMEGRGGRCDRKLTIDKPVFGYILESVVYSLVFSVIAKEVPTVDPPDGPLAPLAEVETLFRVLLPKPVSIHIAHR